MARRQRERRKNAEERFPLLSNLMACYFNQDFDILYGTLDGAIRAAARDGSLDHRRAVLTEWCDWNVSEGVVDDVRPFLYEGFGIEVRLDAPMDGRKLMNRIYDDMTAGVRAETAR